MAEYIEVFNLGDDGDYWLVTGSTDAHSAEVAIRKNDRELGTYLEDEDQLKLTYHRDLVWRYGGLTPSRFFDDEVLTLREHFWKYANDNRRVSPFNGFLVKL